MYSQCDTLARLQNGVGRRVEPIGEDIIVEHEDDVHMAHSLELVVKVCCELTCRNAKYTCVDMC